MYDYMHIHKHNIIQSTESSPEIQTTEIKNGNEEWLTLKLLDVCNNTFKKEP